MVKLEKDAVLVVIDVQKAWTNPNFGKRNNPNAEKVIAKLIDEFRRTGRMVIHVRHDSMNPNSIFKEGKETFEFKDEVKPMKDELVITKHTNSAFIGTGLENTLRKMENPQVFYAGLVTDHCVSATARMSGNLGFRSYVIEDACATFERKDFNGATIPPEDVHRVDLASIDGEFADVIKSSELH
ncbi:MAG: cysteine hydrolase family protein [Thermoplasmata archaeon]